MRNPRTALVTGAGGFIGWPIAAALARKGVRVVALDLAEPEDQLTGCDIEIGSFVDKAFVERLFERYGFDTVVHTGGISGPMLARDNPYLICTTNVLGTINLLEMARQTGVERFVHCGSAYAFGNTPPAPVPDDAPLRATDVYGSTKGASDLILRAYRTQHGLDAVSMRISNGFGPRRRTRCAVRLMLENALDGKPTHLEWGGGYGRAYLYVEDAVTALEAAVHAPEIGQWAYNVAGPDFVTMQVVADIVQRIIPGARITMDDGVDTLGYRREALDITAAGRDLGWTPQFGIERAVTAYRDWIVGQRKAKGATQ
ncbi:MAG: NAD-dependent epimerase/dehydratase family protein [Hyphomicrobiales bacterium]